MALKQSNITIVLGAALLLALINSPQALAQSQVLNETIPVISGGIGDEGQKEIQSLEKDYTLKVIFTGKDGVFLSDIDFKAIDKNGQSVISTVTEGPVLLAKLPTGTYALQATLNGKENAVRIHITKHKLKTLYIRFPDEE